MQGFSIGVGALFRLSVGWRTTNAMPSSWQRHLGAPELAAESDGTFSLLAPGKPRPDPVPAWIYIFDTDPQPDITPSPLIVSKIIGTDAPAVSYWALEVAPAAALSNIDSEGGFLAALARRLRPIWPELALTVTL